MTDDPNRDVFDMKARIEREEAEIERQRRARGPVPLSLFSKLLLIVQAILWLLAALFLIGMFITSGFAPSYY
jgi:hypothetical protein